MIFVRMTSPTWLANEAEVDSAIDGAVDRVMTRPQGSDNAVTATDASGGVYVDVGSTTLPQWQPTVGLPRGTKAVQSLQGDRTAAFQEERKRLLALVRPSAVSPPAVAHGMPSSSNAEAVLCEYELQRLANVRRNGEYLTDLGLGADVGDAQDRVPLSYHAPYRHKNCREPAVQRMAAAVARVMAAGAHAVRDCAPHVYEAWWEPILAAPVIAPALVYPSPAMQLGSESEWGVRDQLPADTSPATIPTGHVAARVSGIPDQPTQARLEAAWKGVSNSHSDPVDAWRRHGVPIVYVPRISPAARQHPRYRRSHPMPSSDLVWCEGREGGRAVRIVTCTEGWACIVCAHYESQLHGGVMPSGYDGRVIDEETGRPFLERRLVPGVELLRAVCYSLARVDAWCMAVQAAYNVRGDGSVNQTPAQKALLQEIYQALDAPLDERFRMLHPWLPRKEDDSSSAPYGARPQAW